MVVLLASLSVMLYRSRRRRAAAVVGAGFSDVGGEGISMGRVMGVPVPSMPDTAPASPRFNVPLFSAEVPSLASVVSSFNERLLQRGASFNAGGSFNNSRGDDNSPSAPPIFNSMYSGAPSAPVSIK